MRYEVKAIIDGVEVLEQSETVVNTDDVEYTEPSVTQIKLNNVVTQNTLPIGDVAADSLTFVLNNPWKPSYDNSKVELWVSEVDDGVETVLDVMGEIEDTAGAGTSDEAIDEDDEANEVTEDDDPGDDMNASEIADVEATEEADNEAQFDLLEGETDTVEAVTTDEGTEPEWVKLGSYFVYSQTNGDKNVKLVCYDNMARLNGTYVPAQTEDTLQNHFNELCTQIIDNTDIVVDTFTFPNVTIKWDKKVTYRDALGYLAGFIGGYVDCDEDGELSIAFASTDADIRVDSDVIGYKESSAGEIFISGIACDRAYGGELTNVITTGVGDDLIFSNPFMEQSDLDDLLEMFSGFRVSGATLRVPWDISMRAGSGIRLMTSEEYEQYILLNNALTVASTAEEILELKTNINGLGKVVFICSQVIEFGGTTVTTITSAASTVSESETAINEIFRKSMKAVEDNAGKTATNYLWYDAQNGLYVTDDTDTLENAVIIDSQGVNIKKQGQTVAEYSQGLTVWSDNGTEIAHLGYGSTQGESGQTTSPYCTLGVRTRNRTIGAYSVAEGYDTTASGFSSHAEGNGSIASGKESHAEGHHTYAKGESSHAEGGGSIADGDNSHAEGGSTWARGRNSHTEGGGSTASGFSSHAEGGGSTASGGYSHAEGFSTTAKGQYQHVQGKFNVVDDSGNYADIVGNGTNETPSNAYALDWSGNGHYKGDVYVGCKADSSDGEKLIPNNFLEVYGSNGAATTRTISSADTFYSPHTQDNWGYRSKNGEGTHPSWASLKYPNPSDGTGIVVIQEDGWYKIDYEVYFFTGFTAGDRIAAGILKNYNIPEGNIGFSNERVAYGRAQNASAYHTLSDSCMINCACNDELRLGGENVTAGRGKISMSRVSKMIITKI